jgi:hypothetical protein
MTVLSSLTHHSPSRRRPGSLCLYWFGTAICFVGFLILARDGLTWFGQGERVEFAITTLSSILPSLPHISAPTAWHQLLQGTRDFCGVTPLSLLLLVLGWCTRTLANVG